MNGTEREPFDVEGHDDMVGAAKQARSSDFLRDSIADKTRPDHFRSLRRRASVSKLVIEEEEEEDDDNNTGENIELDENGEEIRNDKQNARLFRQIAMKIKIAQRLKSPDKSTEMHVEVRLHNVSYSVPLKIDTKDKATVFNQSCFYSFFRGFQRLYQYCKTRRALDYTHIFHPYEKKAILCNANLIFKPGRSYLVMGPPGCGKTTLLQVIAGVAYESRHKITGEPLANKAHISGDITFNGLTPAEAPKMILQNVVSYVEQLDYHEPYLTVRETFDFAQQCRTGAQDSQKVCTDSESTTLVNKDVGSENLTIEGLGLKHVADTFVGNSDVRGVSGGQRRRVTVGEMMMGHNPVACADEISTGLDSASTYDMIRSIVHFAKAAHTTRIISLLQPGPETFSLFDEVVILSEGLVIFAGPIDEVVEYFEDLGYIKPAAMDVADFLQSVSTPDGAEMIDTKVCTVGHLTSEAFAAHWESSSLGNRITNGLKGDISTRWTVENVPKGDEENPTVCIMPLPEAMKITYQNSTMSSLTLVFRRFITIWKRNKPLIIGKALENVAMSITVGTVLWATGKVEYSCDPDDPTKLSGPNSELVDQNINGIYGGLFLACFKILLGLATDISAEVSTRGIFYKQANANFYQSLSFIIGRLLSTLPQRLIETLAFSIPVYFLIRFHLNVGSFLLYLLMILTLAICMNMVFMILVMSFPKKQHVQSVAVFLLLLMTWCGGFIVYPIAIPYHFKWIYWGNPIAWAYQGLLSIEYTSSKYDETRTCIDSAKILLDRGFNADRAWIGWSFVYVIGLANVATAALLVASKYVRFQIIKNKQEPLNGDNKKEQHANNNVPFTKINLTFQNICYDVKSSTGDETLRLLDNVSGAMMSGRMCALMGSSGAGKTTLMDVISLRKSSGEITGTVELNGFPQERMSFLRSSGYVEQFDIQASQLTVQETVIFSARLRLDSRNDATKDDASKLRFVDNVLEMLELTSLKDQQVGDLELNTGLSFEQRKRLAIAVELAGSPSVLFLDEPTSGLDSRGAVVVMRAMKRIADTGRTVCATIHQPSSAVFEMFDDLLLLKKGGKLVFFGDLGENSVHLTNYFEAGGSESIQYGQNPASWMLLASEIKEPAEWAELYTSSNQYRTLMDQINAEHESLDPGKKISFDNTFPTTTKQRIWLMLSRVDKIYRRSPAYNLTRMVFAIVMGMIFGFGSINGNDKASWTTAQVDSLFGIIFFAILMMGVFSIISVIPEVKKVRDVFYKHRASGMMAHHAVLFAIVIGEMPYILLMSVLFSASFFVSLGTFASPTKFLWFCLFYNLNAATYTYFGQLFISLVKDVPTSMGLAGAIIGINLFGSGYCIKPKFGGGPFLPIFYISPGHYAYEGLIMSQFKGLNDTVVADPGSGYYSHLDCDGKDTCTGTMDSYAAFAFGDQFSYENTFMDAGVLVGYLIVAMIGTHWALGHLNYVNT